MIIGNKSYVRSELSLWKSKGASENKKEHIDLGIVPVLLHFKKEEEIDALTRNQEIYQSDYLIWQDRLYDFSKQPTNLFKSARYIDWIFFQIKPFAFNTLRSPELALPHLAQQEQEYSKSLTQLLQDEIRVFDQKVEYVFGHKKVTWQEVGKHHAYITAISKSYPFRREGKEIYGGTAYEVFLSPKIVIKGNERITWKNQDFVIIESCGLRNIPKTNLGCLSFTMRNIKES